MPEFDKSTFARSVAGQLLHRLGDLGADETSIAALSLDTLDLSALVELERLGFVVLRRGAGPMAWRIEAVSLTEAGRARIAQN